MGCHSLPGWPLTAVCRACEQAGSTNQDITGWDSAASTYRSSATITCRQLGSDLQYRAMTCTKQGRDFPRRKDACCWGL